MSSSANTTQSSTIGVRQPQEENVRISTITIAIRRQGPSVKADGVKVPLADTLQQHEAKRAGRSTVTSQSAGVL